MKTKKREPISLKELTESGLWLLKWCHQTIDVVVKPDKKMIPSTDEHVLLREHCWLEKTRTPPARLIARSYHSPEVQLISQTVTPTASWKANKLRLQSTRSRFGVRNRTRSEKKVDYGDCSRNLSRWRWSSKKKQRLKQQLRSTIDQFRNHVLANCDKRRIKQRDLFVNS